MDRYRAWMFLRDSHQTISSKQCCGLWRISHEFPDLTPYTYMRFILLCDPWILLHLSYSGWSVPSAVVGGLGNHVLFSLHLTDHTVFSYCFVWSLLFGPFHFLVSSPHFSSPSPQWSTEQLPNLLKSLCAFVIGISVVICENVLHFIIKREESYTVDPWTMWVLGIHPTPLQSKFCM